MLNRIAEALSGATKREFPVWVSWPRPVYVGDLASTLEPMSAAPSKRRQAPGADVCFVPSHQSENVSVSYQFSHILDWRQIANALTERG